MEAEFGPEDAGLFGQLFNLRLSAFLKWRVRAGKKLSGSGTVLGAWQGTGFFWLVLCKRES